jgi:hypothetical protein
VSAFDSVRIGSGSGDWVGSGWRVAMAMVMGGARRGRERVIDHRANGGVGLVDY